MGVASKRCIVCGNRMEFCNCQPDHAVIPDEPYTPAGWFSAPLPRVWDKAEPYVPPPSYVGKRKNHLAVVERDEELVPA
jgi:hypothetical protein